jgi:hypothetical protein
MKKIAKTYSDKKNPVDRQLDKGNPTDSNRQLRKENNRQDLLLHTLASNNAQDMGSASDLRIQPGSNVLDHMVLSEQLHFPTNKILQELLNNQQERPVPKKGCTVQLDKQSDNPHRLEKEEDDGRIKIKIRKYLDSNIPEDKNHGASPEPFSFQQHSTSH